MAAHDDINFKWPFAFKMGTEDVFMKHTTCLACRNDALGEAYVSFMRERKGRLTWAMSTGDRQLVNGDITPNIRSSDAKEHDL